MAQSDFDDNDPALLAAEPVDFTQPFTPVGEDRLAESMAQLGPKATVYGAVRTPEGIETVATGPFAEFVAKWFAEHVPVAQAKAQQYGSNSLAKKGYRFGAAQGRVPSDSEALELGATQYALEKLDRVEDAMLRREYASNDTWTDVVIYALMILYVRQNGHWL